MGDSLPQSTRTEVQVSVSISNIRPADFSLNWRESFFVQLKIIISLTHNKKELTLVTLQLRPQCTNPHFCRKPVSHRYYRYASQTFYKMAAAYLRLTGTLMLCLKFKIIYYSNDRPQKKPMSYIGRMKWKYVKPIHPWIAKHRIKLWWPFLILDKKSLKS